MKIFSFLRELLEGSTSYLKPRRASTLRRILHISQAEYNLGDLPERITLFRVRIELDHLFVCTTRGAPEAEKLVQLGLNEGPRNEHSGQGTANRRFAFLNAMIELLWVSKPTEAQNQNTARTKLWERWSGRRGNACPFGICVRPVDSEEVTPPFPGWKYRPAYLPDPLFMHIGEAGIEEPMWVYLSFLRRAHREHWFLEHPIGIREITRLTLHSPVPVSSRTSEILVETGILHIGIGPSYLLEIEFDRSRQKQHIDFRPELPVVFQA